MNMGQGVAEIDLYAPDELYDQILMEVVGDGNSRQRSFASDDAGVYACEDGNMIDSPKRLRW